MTEGGRLGILQNYKINTLSFVFFNLFGRMASLESNIND